MEYQGVIKKSRTLDVLALFAVLSSMYPLLMDALMEFGLSPKWVTVVNLSFTGLLAWLRFKTTGEVGDK